MSLLRCVCVLADGLPPCSRLVRSSADVMQLMSSVLKLRTRCPTLVHRDSSRSHLVVTLTVSSKSPNALALGETHTHT